ncbi:peptidylprolyl isomerase [Clostridium sp. KNHs216]|uniref:peptidylprolyl isomerase n=1 Tax=Clostridium sp. KNHs216 TaxID=1550235 RepID=UPI001153D034|nr:peptidylprolyl isomerase [Clostridium sp. KNHs216]TQI66742.1 hypothetical protein LY85_1413 [Clostridium sp. KNHs216]
MTITELKVRRDSILQAITKIENGAQEYRLGQRTVQRADLGTLYGEYNSLNNQIDQLERPAATVAFLRRRR